jgi:hypothetical protein
VEAPLTSAPSDPVVAPPVRRPGSVRRTSTVLMSWPDGLGTPELYLQGRARDLLTPVHGAPHVLAAADLTAVTGRERDIQTIDADPPVAGLQRLVGVRAGSGLRSAIARELPEEVEGGTPLYLLLDDLGGTTLIAGYTYFRWADVFPEVRRRIENGPQRVMQGTCSGFRPGSIALKDDGTLSHVRQNTARTASLVDPSDPIGWHELHEHPLIGMRRARRIDVWANEALIEIDAWFRDSVWTPEGHEEAIHEYQMLGQADRETGTLLSVTAQPRVLPYVECPGAAPNATWMAGTDLRTMRTEVLQRLRATDCCTHLNDGLRSLAEVPVLAASLPD